MSKRNARDLTPRDLNPIKRDVEKLKKRLKKLERKITLNKR